MTSEPVTLSDEAIVARVRAGEAALFELLMRRYNQRLYRTARSILHDETEAEDVLQETYLQAYAHLGEFEGRSRFSSWLTRIAINEALGRLRGRARLALVGSSEEAVSVASEASGGRAGGQPSEVRGPEELVQGRELAGHLERAILSLPESARTVLMLRVVEGLSSAETAESLGVTEESVRVRLHRARALLQKTLFDQALGSAGEAFPFAGWRCDGVVARVLARLPIGPG
jgi:RNA polymerase sigma-70 factor (ECF subfamily)